MTKVEVVFKIPRWGPLERFVLDEESLSDWMWMNAYVIDGVRRIEAYKHRDTKQYIYLNADGRPMSLQEATLVRRSNKEPRFGISRSETKSKRAVDNFLEAIRERDDEALENSLASEFLRRVVTSPA